MRRGAGPSITGAAPRAAGFTLVEVLVALAVMALIAGMAWQGIDAMARSRDAAQVASERTLRLGTVLAQWEADLQSLVPTTVMPALRFDGATATMTREAPGGVQVVAWTWRRGAWWRWASPPVTQVTGLKALEQRAGQLLGTEPGTVRMIDGVDAVQLYFHRDSAWTNAQSSGDAATGPAALPSGSSAAAAERLPNAVRLVLSLPPGALTRDLILPPQP